MRYLVASSAVLLLALGCASRHAVVVEPPPGGAVAGDPGPASSVQIATGDPTQVVASDPQVVADYQATVEKVSSMTSDGDLQARVAGRGLSLVNVMWEDTGRAEGSALGPNITDLTLQVRQGEEAGFATALMPVIRFPNFSDRTADIRADRFFVRVGNERVDGKLVSVPLKDVLRNLRKYASLPRSIKGSGNLLARRDSHFLVSAQAVFLPVPKRGKAEFNPAVFNYQSAPGSPAVLTLLVTREGTSMQVIENEGEEVTAAGYGQELYFNDHGQRTAFTAERKSDVEARIAAQGGPRTESDRTALARGADVLFLVQVPLRHQNRGFLGGVYPSAVAEAPMAPAAKAASSYEAAEEESDVEQAVLGHGPALGPYDEGRGLTLERDPQFPIRITVQFYKATSNGVVSDADLDGIAQSIGSVYEHADFVGSLVLPENDRRRPTAWQSVPNEWFPW